MDANEQLKQIARFEKEAVDDVNHVWIFPDSRPDQYPGSWPLEFEEELLKMYGFNPEEYSDSELKEHVVQLFSGGVRYGFKVDMQNDSHPDYTGDSHHLPAEWTDRWDLCICDPPYTSNWSRVLYGMSEIIYSKYIAEAVRIVKPGGFIANYHWALTPTPDNTILHRRIFLGRDYFKKLRACCIFQKK